MYVTLVPVTLLLLSTADTDLLAARTIAAPALPLRLANPSRVTDPVGLLDGVSLVVVRLLGGRRAWEGFQALHAACLERRIPLVAVGGEGAVDAELADASSVPAGVVADAAAYLREGGPDNLGQLVAFLSDTVLLCTRCHRDVHDGRHALRLKDGRRLSPDGWSP